MREKLLKLMRSEGLTSSRLAELLGIQPSGISHILSGRNKPSFDFVQKILRRFPTINPDWLLLDSEQMYRQQNDATIQSPSSATTPETANMLFSDSAATPFGITASTADVASTSATGSAATKFSPAEGTAEGADNIAATLATNLAQHGRVKRVIVLYEDQTFESYNPSR